MGLFGGTSEVAKAPQTAMNSTFTGNALVAAGKFSNDHSKATKVVEGTVAAVAITMGANALFRMVAPNQHKAWVSDPIQNRIVAPLQKKGLLSSNNKELSARSWDLVDYGTIGLARLFRTNVVSK